MTPHEKATALLAEALGDACADAMCMGARSHMTQVKEAFAASPALAAALELGVAWQMAEAALPEGWAVNLLWGTITEDRWGAHAGPFPAVAGQYRESETAGGPTPTAALNALADALVNRSAGAGDTEGEGDRA